MKDIHMSKNDCKSVIRFKVNNHLVFFNPNSVMVHSHDLSFEYIELSFNPLTVEDKAIIKSKRKVNKPLS